MRTPIPLLAAALSLALLGAGCGSDDAADEPSPTTVLDGSLDASAGEDGSGQNPAGLNVADLEGKSLEEVAASGSASIPCVAARVVVGNVASAVTGAPFPSELVEEAKAALPGEIREDALSLASIFEGLVDEDGQLNMGKALGLQTDESYAPISDRLKTWLSDNCDA